jgi:hypothetical protein
MCPAAGRWVGSNWPPAAGPRPGVSGRWPAATGLQALSWGQWDSRPLAPGQWGSPSARAPGPLADQRWSVS